MRILITNDDGIESPCLLPLAKWAQQFGEVTIVAPKVEQSAKSHGIEIRQAFEVKKLESDDIETYTVDSTPADCVRFAVLGLGKQFDLVLSGINRGLNLGLDIMYSGTISAVMEADAMGIPAIALSTNPGNYDHATEELDRIFAFFRENRLMDVNDIYNVNIPASPKGIRITSQGGPYYSDDFPHMGGDLYRPLGKPIWEDSGNDTLDTDATLHGYITITPLQLDRTNREVFRQLQVLNG